MSTLTKTGLTDEPNHLSVAVSGMRERRFQRVHFGGAANETRHAALRIRRASRACRRSESCDLTVLDLEPQADYPSPLASRGVVGMARDGVE